MGEYVAVDSTSPPTGDQYFIVAAVIEIDDIDEFREYYFDQVREFVRKHNIQIPFPVIKSRTAIEGLPSYEIRDGMDQLTKNLIQNPAISRINIAIGWYGADAELEFKSEDENPINGNTFASNHLSQYFNIVALWRYHRSHDRDLASKAIVDNIQGHITKAWKYCGNTFDIDFIPNGDLTYPSISTADILAYNISGFLNGHEEDKFTEFPELTEDYIVNRRNWETQPYIKADAVNERYTDHIVPTLPYTIQDAVHYRHPVLFVHDDVLSREEKSLLPRTDFHAIARKWAYEHEGCVVNLKPNRLPSIVENNDVIAYTKGSDNSMPKLLQDLHPTKDITVIDSDELYEDLTS